MHVQSVKSLLMSFITFSSHFFSIYVYLCQKMNDYYYEKIRRHSKTLQLQKIGAMIWSEQPSIPQYSTSRFVCSLLMLCTFQQRVYEIPLIQNSSTSMNVTLLKILLISSLLNKEQTVFTNSIYINFICLDSWFHFAVSFVNICKITLLFIERC